MIFNTAPQPKAYKSKAPGEFKVHQAEGTWLEKLLVDHLSWWNLWECIWLQSYGE